MQVNKTPSFGMKFSPSLRQELINEVGRRKAMEISVDISDIASKKSRLYADKTKDSVILSMIDPKVSYEPKVLSTGRNIMEAIQNFLVK